MTDDGIEFDKLDNSASEISLRERLMILNNTGKLLFCKDNTEIGFGITSIHEQPDIKILHNPENGLKLQNNTGSPISLDLQKNNFTRYFSW